MVFLWSLSDNKFPQVSRILLSILADLNNTIVWRFSAHHPIFNSSRPFTIPLGIVPSAPTKIGITVTFTLYRLFSSLVKFKCLSPLSFSLTFAVWSAKMAKYAIRQFLFYLFLFFFFFFFCQSLSLVFWLGLCDLFVSQNSREFHASHY